MHLHMFVYFGMRQIRNVNTAFPNPPQVSDIQNLVKSQQKIDNCHDRVRSDMIYKASEGSINNNSLDKFIIH